MITPKYLVEKTLIDPDTGYVVDGYGRVVDSWFAKLGVKPTAYQEYKARELFYGITELGNEVLGTKREVN